MALVKLEIPPRSRRCSQAQEEFSQGMEYVSMLEVGEKDNYQRKDFCISCWEKLINFKEASLGKIHWKSTIPLKKQDKVSMRKDEIALELLREIHQNSNDAEASEAFILTLLLVRKKIIQFKQEIVENETTLLLYEVVDTEEMLGIKKIELSSIQTEKIQINLAQKLHKFV